MAKLKSLIGQKFGRLTVIENSGERAKNGYILWRCRCECGNEKLVLGNSLKAGYVQSCGCLNTENRRKMGKKNGTDKLKIFRESVCSNNTSGITGVCWNKHANKWMARIRVDYKLYNLGLSDNKEECIQMRKAAEQALRENKFEEYVASIVDHRFKNA